MSDTIPTIPITRGLLRSIHELKMTTSRSETVGDSSHHIIFFLDLGQIQRFNSYFTLLSSESRSRCDGCGFSGSDFLAHRCHKEVDSVQVSKLNQVSSHSPYNCHICVKTFSTYSVLKQHSLVHSKAKPHKCQMCAKCFSRKGVLKRHLVTHSKEKPYRCELCPKRFTQKGSVAKHMVVHTGEKPYHCEKCYSCFTEKGNLLKHLRVIHKEKERYKCPKCSLRFALKSELTEHANCVHLASGKSLETIPSLKTSCTPETSEHDSDDRNLAEITAVPFTSQTCPSTEDNGSTDSQVSLLHVSAQNTSSCDASNNAQRTSGQVNVGLSQGFSRHNLPKRSSIFLPLFSLENLERYR